jgi:hypothetical protein
MTASRGSLARRVLQEHRAWIWPLAVLLGLNVLALMLGILPMSRAVASDARQAAARTPAAASELAAATAHGRPRYPPANRDFHREVLPKASAKPAVCCSSRWRSSPAPTTSPSRAASPRQAIRGCDLARLRRHRTRGPVRRAAVPLRAETSRIS